MKGLSIIITAILGYGFPIESFIAGMERKPHVIAVDAGSTDPVLTIWEQANLSQTVTLLRDLEIMIPAALEAGIPLIIGTAGGSGGKPHVNLTVDIIKEITRERVYLISWLL